MNAKQRFERTRKSVMRLAEVQALIMYECDDWLPPNVHSKHEISDPTANRAIRNVDIIAEKLESLRTEETELLTIIGESLRIIGAVRRGFGEKYGDILDRRYIDTAKWTDIADEYDVTERTVQNWACIAFDWIDSIGIARLLAGDTEI